MRDHSKMLTIAAKPKNRISFVKLGFLVAAGIGLMVKLAQGVMTTEASVKKNQS